MDNRQRKRLKAIGQRLKPVVTVAARGLADGVLAELERALADHELIKVRLAIGDRSERAALTRELCARLGAECVQAVGRTILLYRPAPHPDPRLSNLLRPLP